MKNFQIININPLTYILVFLILSCGLFKYFLIILLIMITHEVGHIILCLIFKRKITKINIYPTGALFKIDAPISSLIGEDLLISIGGIFAQIVLSFILNKINPNFIDTFNYYNKLIILFNLIPIYPLDGSKILGLFLDLFIPFKWSLKLNFIISILFTTLFIIFYKDLLYSNILVLLFIVVMQYKFFSNKTFILYSFFLERLFGNFYFSKSKHISKISHMYKNRLNILNGEDEKTFLSKLFSKINYMFFFSIFYVILFIM